MDELITSRGDGIMPTPSQMANVGALSIRLLLGLKQANAPENSKVTDVQTALFEEKLVVQIAKHGSVSKLTRCIYYSNGV